MYVFRIYIAYVYRFQIPFLIDVNEGFLRMASVYVQQVLLGPGEYIVHLDDLAEEIFFIRNGKVMLVHVLIGDAR
jgi:CRP-like cAMP-binding protein